MAKQRTSITINPELHELGKSLAKEQHFDDFSNFVEHLIRSEWERRQTSRLLETVQPAALPAVPPQSKEILYRMRKR